MRRAVGAVSVRTMRVPYRGNTPSSSAVTGPAPPNPKTVAALPAGAGRAASSWGNHIHGAPTAAPASALRLAVQQVVERQLGRAHVLGEQGLAREEPGHLDVDPLV